MVNQALVGQLKQSAIDAWMAEQGWRKHDDHHYEQGGCKVTRPSADGEGGANWSSDWFNELFVDRDAEFAGYFATIRQTIDDLVGLWLQIPEPSLIAEPVEDCRQVTRRLSGAATATNNEVTGGGELAVNIKLVDQNLSSMSGGLISSYKSKFLAQLGRAVGGFHAISVVRGTDLAGEQALWTEVHKALDEILVTARTAMDKIAQGSAGEWKDILTATGWVAQGVGIFASEGVSAAFEVTGLAISILSATTVQPQDDKAPKSPGSYSAVIGALRSQLEKLQARVKAEEQLVEDNLRTNLANIRRDRSSYDLTEPAIYKSEDLVILNRSMLAEIYQTYMPAIATELDAIAAVVEPLLTHTVLVRDASIGIGWSGPSDSFSELNRLLYDLLKDLAWEAREGARMLELAAEDIAHADERVAENLRKIAKEIDQKSQYASWS